MKIVVLIALLVSGTTAFAQTKDVGKIEWLSGAWTRTNAKAGRSGAEIWTKKSATEITGRGISLKGADTTFVEKLKIVAKDGKLFYVADVPNQAETWFEFTEITEHGFVCENPKHDFPKKISYQLTGNDLKATISGDGKAVDYMFVRSK